MRCQGCAHNLTIWHVWHTVPPCVLRLVGGVGEGGGPGRWLSNTDIRRPPATGPLWRVDPTRIWAPSTKHSKRRKRGASYHCYSSINRFGLAIRALNDARCGGPRSITDGAGRVHAMEGWPCCIFRRVGTPALGMACNCAMSHVCPCRQGGRQGQAFEGEQGFGGLQRGLPTGHQPVAWWPAPEPGLSTHVTHALHRSQSRTRRTTRTTRSS